METTKANQANKHNFFIPLTLAYLIVPNLIFLATWVRPWIGVPAMGVVVICSILLVRQSFLGGPSPQFVNRRNLIFILTLAFFWTMFAGAGGFVPQAEDYQKHNLVFHDLTNSCWPVKYPLMGGGSNYLCYGLGYYLVPALGGRILGTGALPMLSFLWTFIGVTLFFYWIASFTKTSKLPLLIFLLFAATNIGLLALKRIGVPGLVDATHVYEKLWQFGLYHSYHDPFTKLQYQPQHCLVAWLGVACFYEMLWVRKDPRGAVFTWAACLIWSPMTCLGLLLVPLAALRRVPWRLYFSPINLTGGGILLAVGVIYFQGHVVLADRGFIWNLSSGGEWFLFYLLFVVFELSPFLLLFLIDQKYQVLGESRPLLLVAVVFLLLLPLWKIGYCGDLRLQAGTPALVLSALCAIRCLQSGRCSLKRPLFVLFASSVLLGAVYPLARPWLNLITNRSDYSYAHTAETLKIKNLSEYKLGPLDAATQYLGRDDSLAARWLLR